MQRRIQTLKVIPIVAVRSLAQEHLVAFVGVGAIAHLAAVVASALTLEAARTVRNVWPVVSVLAYERS